MARPVNADADATKKRVLQSAVSLFSERGIEGTTVRDVARGAGVTLATVHHYFGSKESLFEACIASVYDGLDGMGQELAALFTEGEELTALVTRAMAVASQYARKNRTVVRLLVRTSVSTGRVPPRGEKMLLEDFLPNIAGLASAATGRPELEVRLALQTLVFLSTRYAVQDPDELVATLGLPKGEHERAWALLDAHLGAVARSLLLPTMK